MWLLTLVGNDAAPAAWAAKVFLRRFGSQDPAPRIGLLESGSQDPVVERWRQLKAWLEEQGFQVESLTWNQVEHLGPQVVVNLTAGTKEEFFRLYRLAEEKGFRGFILDAHSSPPILAWRDGRTEPLAEDDLLTLKDYNALYLKPRGARLLGQAKRKVLPSGLLGPTWHWVEVEGRRVLFAVHQGIPCVFDPEAHQEGNFKDQLNILARRAKDLGGQMVRAFAQVPEGRPQDENDRNTLLLQAKEARVELVFPDTRTGELFSPFTLPDTGPVLLGLVSEQPVPLLASFLAHKPKRVYLLSSHDLEARLGRLEAAEEVFQSLGARVEVATVLGPRASGEVEHLLRPVVEHAVKRGLEVIANLNGGTKLLSLGLLKALSPEVVKEYLRGNTLQSLDGPSNLEVPWEDASIDQVLQLFGYRLKSGAAWHNVKFSHEVLRKAKAFLNNPKEDRLADSLHATWQQVFQNPSSPEAQPPPKERGQLLGLALEYVVFAELQRFLEKNRGKVAPPGSLKPRKRVHNPREVDGVFWLGGSLGFVECKPKLADALKHHHEDAALWVLGERFGGLFGRGILVVRRASRPGQASQEGWQEKLIQVLKQPWLRIFSLEGRLTLEAGTIWAFPEDLHEALRDWL